MPRLLQQGPCHTDEGMLTPDTLRAARALLKWSRDDLAEKSGVAAVTIKGFEILGADSKNSTLNKLRRALEGAGIEFLYPEDGKGEGVRFRSATRGRR